MPLRFAPSPKPREGLLSLMSRAAGERGLSVGSFCNELGLSFRKLVNHDEEQIALTADLLRLDAKTLAEVRSWSIQQLPGVKVKFRGETYVSRALMNPTIRGCLSCLRDDVSTDQVPPPAQMVMQAHWQLRYVELCHLHGRPLVPLWNESALLARHDFATHLSKLSPEILKYNQTLAPQPITSFDVWLDLRMSNHVDRGWLSSHDVDSAATFCNLLGGEMVRAFPEQETEEKPARAIGFDISNQGTDAISQALHDLSLEASGRQDGMSQAFGHLYRWLAHNSAEDQRCDVFRDLMRDVILDTWEIPTGDIILGAAVQKRRLHSVQSASIEIGRSVKVTRQLLEHAGVIDIADLRPHKRLTFGVAQAKPTLDWCARLVRAPEMAARLGASSGQFDTLIREGLIKPTIPIGVSKFQWDTADADEFLNELAANAKTVTDDGSWVSLPVAAGRARVSVSDAINAVCDGKVDVVTLKGHRGYAAIHVRQSDIDGLNSGRPLFPTLAEFGLEVGLQKNGMMNALVDAGHVQATRLFNPSTLRMGLFMNDEDCSAFYAQFTTSKILSESMGIQGRVLTERLRRCGISNFKTGNLAYKKVYLLSDMQRFTTKFGEY